MIVTVGKIGCTYPVVEGLADGEWHKRGNLEQQIEVGASL